MCGTAWAACTIGRGQASRGACPPRRHANILRWTVERIPHEATHWSLRLMAKHARVSQWHVAQVWKAADLRPHRLETLQISRCGRRAAAFHTCATCHLLTRDI